MYLPTLHTGFNKFILNEPIVKGDVHSSLQFSMYIPSIEKLHKDGVDYQRGELFQKGLSAFESVINQRSKLIYSFIKMARDMALKEDICAYCFMLPNAKSHLSYAISTSEGCRYIELMGKNDKQVSINQYIVNTLNQNGWF